MIIGITGKKTSGKDILADYLIDNFRFTGYKFADPIKRIMADVFLMTEEQVNGNEKEILDTRWGITSRQGQQVVGTELLRDRFGEVLPAFGDMIGKDIWAMRFKYWYEMSASQTDVVVSDLRFLNEERILKQMGAHIIRVERNGLVSNDTHASEMEMDYITPEDILYNDSSIASLELKMGLLYKKYLTDSN